jgi:hypothetical protein
VLGAIAPARAQDASVSLALRNDGGNAIRCVLMLGHWVTRDVPRLAPGATTTVTMSRQPEDGALYFLRSDGRRRLMVETLLCGDDSRWWETRAEIPLDALRQGASSLQAACRTGEPLLCGAQPAP